MEIIHHEYIDFERFKGELIAKKENRSKIIDNLYQYIKLIESKEKSDKTEYIVRHIKYWGFNTTRLSMDFLLEYFKKLVQDEKLPFTETVLQSNEKMQWSFATKMQHLFNQEKPIWDSNIKKVLGIKNRDINTKTYDCYCQEFFRLVIKYTHELNSLRSFLSNFNISSTNNKTRYQEEYVKKNILNKQKISDVKLLDSVIWFLGGLKSNKI